MSDSNSFLTKEELFNKTLELDELVRGLEPLDAKKFTRFRGRYVYSELLRNKSGDVVTGLNFTEQLYILEQFGKEEGLDTRHGTLEENFLAAYSEETSQYKKCVLLRYPVYVREMVTSGSVTFADKAVFVDAQPGYRISTKDNFRIGYERYIQRIVGDRSKSLPKLKPKIFDGKSISEQIVLFTEFVESDVMPQLRHLDWTWSTIESKDDYGLSSLLIDYSNRRRYSKDGKIRAVPRKERFKNDREVNYFSIRGVSPSERIQDSVIPVWTNENPKR